MAQASDALQAEARADGGSAPAALSHWCAMLRALLEPQSATSRQEALRRLALSEEVRTHRLLRGVTVLAQGEASLASGAYEDAERRITRCAKLSVGDSRCDALTVRGVTALAAVTCSLLKVHGSTDAAGASAAAAGGPSEGGGEQPKDPRRRRTEDSLSSALVLSSKMEDLHAQQNSLKMWTDYYTTIGDGVQAEAFGDLFGEFSGKLRRRLDQARSVHADMGVLAQRALDGKRAE